MSFCGAVEGQEEVHSSPLLPLPYSRDTTGIFDGAVQHDYVCARAPP
jgi:hypothetical protein